MRYVELGMVFIPLLHRNPDLPLSGPDTFSDFSSQRPSGQKT
jgi:hypothetical protein